MEFKQRLQDRLIDFAAAIIVLANNLPDSAGGKHLMGQLIRSGTSPALNYGEALGAESRKDFVHKLSVVVKELRESQNCLRILRKTSHIEDEKILKECNELIAIFVTSINTTKARMNGDKEK